MKIINPSHQFETPIAGDNGREMLRLIERAARTCYKSECKITSESAGERVLSNVFHSPLCEAVIFVQFRHNLEEHLFAFFTAIPLLFNEQNDVLSSGGEVDVTGWPSAKPNEFWNHNTALQALVWGNPVFDCESNRGCCFFSVLDCPSRVAKQLHLPKVVHLQSARKEKRG